MKNNKGFTLTEVIVSMTVIAIVFVGVFTAFMTIGKMNVVSRVSQSENDIAVAMLDCFYDKKYSEAIDSVVMADELKSSIPTQFILGTDFEINSSVNNLSSDFDYGYELHNINGVASSYDVRIGLKKIDNSTIMSNPDFSSLNVLGQQETRILNIASDNGIVQQALNELYLKHKDYASSTGIMELSQEDFNKYINCELQLSYYKEDKDFISAVFNYSLSDMSLIDSSVSFDALDLMSNDEIDDLAHFVLFVPKLDNYNSYKINVVNGKSGSISNDSSTDLFIICTDKEDIKEEYTFGNLTFSYNQSSPDIAKLHTNITDINNSVGFVSKDNNIISKINLVNDTSDVSIKMYEIEVMVTEKSGTFHKLTETILSH